MDVVHRLKTILDDEDISQEQLAGLLGLSQGHLSKLLSGKCPSGRRTAARVRALAFPTRSNGGGGGWLKKVESTARKSPEFRALVGMAMKMVD